MFRRSWFDPFLLRAARAHARIAMSRFFRCAAAADEVQSHWLLRRLKDGIGGEYGRAHGMGRLSNYEDFAAAFPVQPYAAFAPYIDRVREGDTAALFHPRQRVLMFALTSGTTAQPKYIPVTQAVLSQWRAGWNVWGLRALLDHAGCFLRDIVQVTSPINDHLTPSGIPCGAITGLLAATQKRLVRRYYAAPLPVAQIRDAAAKYYTIMRLSIWRDVAFMVTASPATLLLLARTADEQRERIIRDIHDGTLCSEVPVEPDVRAALTPWLSSQPEAAKRLGRMAEMNGRLYPRDYWRLGFVAHWTGGTMGLYRSQFPKYFGDTPTRDIGLLASEGRMSIPVSDGTAAGLLAVNNQFFEFIPAREYGAGQPRVLRVHEVEIGREYFLVVTNDSGLIRYDLGDRVRVTGREGQTPLIEFLSRDAHTSSLAGEKLTEHQVVDAMERLCADCDETIVDFVLAPRWDETPGYRLYVEQSAMSGISKLAERLDAFLCDVNFEYCTRRDSGRLQPIELALLPGGCLAERDRRIRQLRARTSEQFKHQYLLSSPGQDAELEALIMNCASNPHHATRRAETVPATSISDRIVNG